MIRIGEFANIFDVSIKTIRLYEEKGLIITTQVIDTLMKKIEEMTKMLILKDLDLSFKKK